MSVSVQLNSEDDYLLLSGIQHMAFCKRQWALIHIEQQWGESDRTIEGKYLHKNADDPFKCETRKNLRIVRSMPVISHALGLSGVADVVEFEKNQGGTSDQLVTLKGRKGLWSVKPIEYKRGRPKKDDRDAVQLCAQGMALEEMFNTNILSGALFYWQTKHRTEVVFTLELRQRVIQLSLEMHKMFLSGLTPPAIYRKHCELCSLNELCQPKLTSNPKKLEKYYSQMLYWGKDGE